jgi:hypothetical protein
MSTARQHFGLFGPGTVVVETKIGAAYLIATQAREALRPDDPRALRVQLPLEPRRVRDDVQTDISPPCSRQPSAARSVFFPESTPPRALPGSSQPKRSGARRCSCRACV